jgi:hypothetical protein
MHGNFSEDNVVVLIERARRRMASDPRHAQKIEAARNRYSDFDEAR